jgi:hypothetical protein
MPTRQPAAWPTLDLLPPHPTILSTSATYSNPRRQNTPNELPTRIAGCLNYTGRGAHNNVHSLCWEANDGARPSDPHLRILHVLTDRCNHHLLPSFRISLSPIFTSLHEQPIQTPNRFLLAYEGSMYIRSRHPKPTSKADSGARLSVGSVGIYPSKMR